MTISIFPIIPVRAQNRRIRWITFFAFLVLIVSAITTASASFDRLARPASLLGHADAGCAGGSADCTVINPSALAGTASVHLTLYHSPSPFGLSELSRSGVSAALPIPLGAIQCTFTRFGSDLYREHTLMLTYAVRLDDTFAAGVSYSYNALSIERYGSTHAAGIDLGITAAPAPGLLLGASVLNVNRPAIGALDDELPRTFALGLSYRISPQTGFFADLVKDIRFPESIHAGIEVSPLNFITLRTGASTEPPRFYGGIGIHLGGIGINYAIITHQELGLTHAFEIAIDP